MSEIAASSPLRMAGTIRTALTLALALAPEAGLGLAFTIENAGHPRRPYRWLRARVTAGAL
jgi:hypothetical protein